MTLEIRVYGIVQGVGFRPTIARHAKKLNVTGTIANKGPYVEMIASGEKEVLDAFVKMIQEEPPRRAEIIKMEVKEIKEQIFDDFAIITSKKTKGPIFIPPDIATCEECERELFDPHNRRYLHPFINCTSCGPRLTILEGLPYDRERTSMKEFPMCDKCAKEYHDPASRRYDAQPVCCNDCGPEVYLLDTDIKGREAIIAARKALIEGKIIAIKGIGGFHLACDARNEESVALLRERKHRPAKPFAVMAKNLETAKSFSEIGGVQEKIMKGHRKPICLLPKKEGLAESVAPGNPFIGVMLPYAPLQMLLFTYDDGLTTPDVLVMTSANDSGAPITHNDEEARIELSSLCDLILSHNRKIRVRCDDSVLDFDEGEPYMIRRSRGYAPLPYMMSKHFKGDVLAMGGELKNTFCVGKDDLFYPSSYIGDLSDIRSIDTLKETAHLMCELLETDIDAVACDTHPLYHSREVAETLGKPVVYVQHHYAHILSCMAENDTFEKVLGASFDGTGYGDDGTIWGGEIMLCDLDGYKRLTSIKPFLQVGGDASSKEGWRIAVSQILSLYEDPDQIIKRLDLCDAKTLTFQKLMHAKKINAVMSTSAGRLFDSVSAILGIRKASSFEGESSMALEYAALKGAHFVKKEMKNHQCLATDDLVKYIIEKRLQNEDVNRLAYEFHVLLARMIGDALITYSNKTHVTTIALSGGVFQNTLLLDEVKKVLKKAHLKVLTHHLVPCNDGGIALGQAVYASNALMKGRI
jgi:hydrogenase maturation protein HypF